MKTAILVVACMGLLIGGGCGREPQPVVAKQPSKQDLADAAAIDAVKSLLRDPASAQFRNVRRVPMSDDPSVQKLMEKVVYCGEVNSKNAFGGYVGFARFAVLPWAADKSDEAHRVPGKAMSVYVVSDSDPASPIGVDPFCRADGEEKKGSPIKV